MHEPLFSLLDLAWYSSALLIGWYCITARESLKEDQ